MRVFLCAFLVFSCGATFAQSLPAVEDSIAFYHNIVRTTSNDEIRVAASDKMKGFFMDAFTFPETFEYPFSKLNFCKLTSSDGRVRLINWNVSLLDGTHNYVCYVLLFDAKTKTYSWTELQDNARQTEKVETKYLTADKWYGTLYYEIIPLGKKRKKTDTYTLLGWDGNDKLTTRKVIDVLKITNGKLKFGEEIFKSDKKHAKRIIYEYSDDVSASVKYYLRKNHIVVDHLAPRNPIMQGIFADYGPDGTYDRWTFVEGKWVFEDNIDVTVYTEDDKRPFNLPKE